MKQESRQKANYTQEKDPLLSHHNVSIRNRKSTFRGQAFQDLLTDNFTKFLLIVITYYVLQFL